MAYLSVASAIQFFSPRSCCIAFSNLQLQSRKRSRSADTGNSTTQIWRSSSKSAPKPSVFQNIEMEIELSLQSCALFVDGFPRSRCGTTETATLLRRPRKPLYPKKNMVSRPRVLSPVNSRVPELFHFPTT